MQEQAVLWIKGALDVNNPLEEREKYMRCALCTEKEVYIQFTVSRCESAVRQHVQNFACMCLIPVLSNRMTMLFHARLWSDFSMVAFLQAFRASMCLFWSAYYSNKRDQNSHYVQNKNWSLQQKHCTGVHFHFNHYNLFTVNNLTDQTIKIW